MNEFKLTVMHPGGGTFNRTVVAEHLGYDEVIYHFYNGEFEKNHQTVSLFPICCTIVESETEIENEAIQPEMVKNKIEHKIS